MIMILLPWWTYVLLGTVCVGSSLLGVWLANRAELGTEQPDDGPFPCLHHLGTDDDGAEDWCWQMAGHPGDHLGGRQEWPELPELPQRVSRGPEQCATPVFDGSCRRPQGHPGRHI